MVAFVAVVLFSVLNRGADSGYAGRNESGGTVKLLNSTNKVALAREAALRMDSSAVPGLTICLRKDPDPAVRAACAEALGQLRDNRATPDLVLGLCQDPSPEVRRTIALVFEASGLVKDARFFEVIEKRLAEDGSPAVRREIVRIMARLGTHDAKRAISSRISDEDDGVREEVGKAFSSANNRASAESGGQRSEPRRGSEQ